MRSASNEADILSICLPLLHFFVPLPRWVHLKVLHATLLTAESRVRADTSACPEVLSS